MDLSTFNIDNGPCFKPLICSSLFGFSVVWATDDGLYSTIVPLEESDEFEKTLIASGTWEPIFMHYCSNYVFLAAKSGTKNSIFILDDNGKISRYFKWPYDQLLTMWENSDENALYFITFNDIDEIMTVYKTTIYIDNFINQAIAVNITNKVYSTPIVLPFNNSFFAAWLDKWDNIVYTDGKSVYKTNEFTVDYLLGTCNGNDIILAGYSTNNECMTILKINSDNEIMENYYYNINDYKGVSFYIAGLYNGFMLLADSGDSGVKYQRFTNTNCFIYKMQDLPNIGRTWNPVLAQNGNISLLIYLEDIDNESQLHGKFIKTGEISELE
jgi:hypothetical protein